MQRSSCNLVTWRERLHRIELCRIVGKGKASERPFVQTTAQHTTRSLLAAVAEAKALYSVQFSSIPGPIGSSGGTSETIL